MHSKKVFHRDIKCENVLIEQEHSGLRVRLIDFGCSCFVTKKPFTKLIGTASGFGSWCISWSLKGRLSFKISLLSASLCLSAVGTPLFFPPEFYKERLYDATPTTVWQLGALLCVMMFGRRTFYSCIYCKLKVADYNSIRTVVDNLNMTQSKIMMFQ